MESSLVYTVLQRSLEMLDESWVIVETSEEGESHNTTEEERKERKEREEMDDWTGQKWCKYV